MLKESTASLVEQYDLVMFDLDGVVYVGSDAVDRVAERLDRLRDHGNRLAFITNNASRPPEKVVAKLAGIGVAAEVHDVVTSAQAAASLIRHRFGENTAVMLLGGPGLESALAVEGLRVTDDPEQASCVVSGYGPEVLWKDVMRVATLVRRGLPYVATNTDLTIPTALGPAPGHGTLVRTISEFAGVEPIVAGKPARPLLDETIERVGGERPLMVGDRLDTDIEGAHAVGVDSLLVLTGVSGLVDLAASRAERRPSYISPDLEGLFEPHPVTSWADGVAELGGWRASVRDGTLAVAGEGSAADWWRAAGTASWSWLDEHGEPADVTSVEPPRHQ